MRRLALLLVFVLAVFAPASASILILPYPSFTNGQIIDATQFNANTNATLAVINGGIEHVNLGPLGIYGSDIKPTSTAQATFGGSFAYTFSNGLVVNGGFTLGTALPIASGGTGTATPAIGATLPITISGTFPNQTLACGGCVTAVTAGTPLSASAGTTPNITLGTVPVANGGTNLTTLAGSKCMRSASATAYAEAAGDCVTNVTASSPISSSGGTTPNLTFSATAAGLTPRYDASGNLQNSSTLHTVVLTGTIGTSLTSCLGSTNVYCATVSLTGASQFTSGGSSSTSPSFNCGGFFYYSNTYFVNSMQQSPTTMVGISAGTPNTIYIEGPSGAPFNVVCTGY